MNEIKPKNLKECVTLKELFCEWKNAHKEDTDDQIINATFPQGKDKYFAKSFCEDGKLGNSENAKILFICRESNVGNGEPPQNNSFWMKKVVETMTENDKNNTHNYYETDIPLKPNDKRSQTVYYNYLKKICDILNVNICDCAYMNLNKRGGLAKCNFKKLANYIKLYREYILAEIKILKPESVVFLGYDNSYGDEVLNIIEEYNSNINWCSVYHPSAPGKYTKAFDKVRGLGVPESPRLF